MSGFIAVLVLYGCRSEANVPFVKTDFTERVSSVRTPLIVLAAASLSDVFAEIGEDFESLHPEVDVIFNFASSHQLSNQLVFGAPGDVFASANHVQMEAAVRSGRIARGTVQTFARNRLVIVYSQRNPAEIRLLEDLRTREGRWVIAAPEVPAGRYALEFLDNVSGTATYGADFKDRVLKRVVSYEQSVRSVLMKVVLGEADAGIVYASDLKAGIKGTGGWVDIPDSLNVTAVYPIAPLRDSGSYELAAAFVEHVLSPRGQQILIQYGFQPVGAL